MSKKFESQLFMHKQAGNCCFMDRNTDHPKLNRSSRWAINLSSSLVAEFSSSSNLFRKLTIGVSQRSTSCLRWIALYCIEDNKRFGSSDILRAEGATRATVNLTSVRTLRPPLCFITTFNLLYFAIHTQFKNTSTIFKVGNLRQEEMERRIAVTNPSGTRTNQNENDRKKPGSEVDSVGRTRRGIISSWNV
ncbi:hypothetical protein HZH66_014664 [Vespula vulgaris]|uniref:Uncharacterized protein n=1 Tax=Vespula vulgaris TaxID=7454 RepID=A0A834J4J0_VESVU|nr:hypothetical protein HZH66_014664 [Vespula vulgaris]